MRNNIYSVSQVNKYIKNMFQNDYMLSGLEIKGEISNLKYHSSGHIYFTLKDELSAIKVVMFAQYARLLKVRLKEGMQVVITGYADVYERDGAYQIYAKAVREEGIGNLFEEFERLKKKLSEQGMFDPSYKRPIPKYVRTLGVVTAKTGAAVRDIIDVSKRRNPGIQIVLYPAIVQGSEAPESIISGIKALEEYGVDVIICGRGGGSIEDLWGFNDEMVANAIFNCSVPVISAVGHETDFTIADFVADLRAPTPSAAAELAVCDISVTLRELNNKKEILNRNIQHILVNFRNDILRYENRLAGLNPVAKLEKSKQLLEKYRESIKNDFLKVLNDRKQRLLLDAERLHGKSPLLKLSSGYSYVEGKDKKAVKSVKDVSVNDNLTVNVTDGKILVSVLGTEVANG